MSYSKSCPTSTHELEQKNAELTAEVERLREMISLREKVRTTRKECVAENMRALTLVSRLHAFIQRAAEMMGGEIKFLPFGSLMTFLMHPELCESWKPGDIDIRVEVSPPQPEDSIDQIVFFRALLNFCTDMKEYLDQARLKINVVSESLGYRARTDRRQRVQMNVFTLSIAGVVDDVHANAQLDLVIQGRGQMPDPEANFLGWRFISTSSGFALTNPCINKSPIEMIMTMLGGMHPSWTGPDLPSQEGWENCQFYMYRLYKLVTLKGIRLSNPPLLLVDSVTFDCPVCQEKEMNHLVLPCSHTICLMCASKLRDNRCPSCRDCIRLLGPDADVPVRLQALIKDDGASGGGTE